MGEEPIIRWRRDKELVKEVLARVEKQFYENNVVFYFGLQIGKRYPKGNTHLIFRAPTEYPDATLVNEDTGEVIEVEFEKRSSDFKTSKHDPSKCDLIVCATHDWKECPLPVYALTEPRLLSLVAGSSP
jgi:hypothetical protein